MVRNARSITAKCSIGERCLLGCKIEKSRSNEKQLIHRWKFGSPKSLIQVNNGQNSELVSSLFSAKLICSVENMWRHMWYNLSVKEYISAMKNTKLCTQEWYYLLVIGVYTILCETISSQKTVRSKIILWYLLLLEIYTLPFFGLHCLVDEEEEPP